MLNFSHSLVVGTFLFLLVPSVALGQRDALITWRERVEYTLISKNARCLSLPQKLSAATSSRAPSSLFAVRCIRCSLVIGCREGSVPTLWQTSLISSAVMSRSSYYDVLMEIRHKSSSRHAPLKTVCHMCTEEEDLMGASHIASKEHHERHSYAVQIRVLQ